MSSDKFAGQIPTILKLNNSDTLAKIDQPCSAVTGSVEDALRLGCTAIGFTIYPGSGARNTMYEEIRELIIDYVSKSGTIPTTSDGNWSIQPREAAQALIAEERRRGTPQAAGAPSSFR